MKQFSLRYSLAVVLLFVSYCIKAQVPNDTIRFGGIKMYADKQEVIEKAIFGVYYQFSQQATENRKPVIIQDTLLLVVGNTTSVFLDPLYKDKLEKARRERISRSRKSSRVIPHHNNVDEVIELISSTSDYKEERNGDPLQIYKDRSKNSISSVYNAFVDNFITEQRIDEFQNWKITEETDSVFGYPCIKAIVGYAGRKYTAWFTPEIPVNDGPWKFNGLPGLILKVSDDDNLFQYLAIGLEQYGENVEIVKDKVDYEKPSLANFNKFVSNEKSKNRVSFYHNGEFYMTFKNDPVAYSEIEILK